MNKEIISLGKQILVFIISLFGYLGFFLIVYSMIAKNPNIEWLWLENVANKISIIATLLGVIICAISIYFPINVRLPLPFSKYFSAPVVILGAFIGIIAYIFFKINIPHLMLNGFALLAISGALFRLLSR
jgi:hypothetical protein